MPLIRISIFILVLSLLPIDAQNTGTLEVNGRIKVDGKQERLKRKRFFIFRGGLTANKALVDRLRSAEFVSRDCFYCTMKASPEFRAWLKAEDCESPFCREITADDAAKVPEFKAAVAKGSTQFGRKPELAREWLMTNLPPGLRDGFYLQRKSAIDRTLAGLKPLMSGMTDSVSVKAIFIDIPVAPPAGKSTETFLVSNIAPAEIGGKSFVWACEVEIGADKKAVRSLPVPEPGKKADKCEVFVKDVPACNGQTCQAK
ncbi:MAG TPA: hypothetical protein VJV05_12540 [Pyrinomonadaceae bacterium]|nr:hypothetical protein [Pyrinomonadaceae bacterium]